MEVLGLTNAFTDYIVSVSEVDAIGLELDKGGFTPFDKVEPFVRKLNEASFKKFVGGGACNTIRGINNLGNFSCSLMGVVGNDKIGASYVRNLEDEGIATHFSKVRGKSGRCYTFITPDGKRSFSLDIGVARSLEYLDFSANPSCGLFHFTGYELYSNPVHVSDFVKKLKKNGTKISFDMGYAGGINEIYDYFTGMISVADVLFSTENEMDIIGNLEYMINQNSVWVLKKGERGSHVWRGNSVNKINAVKVNIVNENGEGDGYAAGFLTKYMQGKTLRECGEFGSLIAARVCSREESYYS